VKLSELSRYIAIRVTIASYAADITLNSKLELKITELELPVNRTGIEARSRFGVRDGSAGNDPQAHCRSARLLKGGLVSNVVVVTDSVAAVPESLVRELGVRVVPIMLNHEGRSYRDGVTRNP